MLRLERFDPRRDTWTRGPDLPGEARAAAGAALGGRLLVIGGQTQRGVSRRVYAYDVQARKWSVRAPLPSPRYNAGAATLDGRLYLAGGVRNVDPVRTVFVYDGRRWRRAAAPSAAHPVTRCVPRRALGDRGLRRARRSRALGVDLLAAHRALARRSPARGSGRDGRRSRSGRPGLRSVRAPVRVVCAGTRVAARPSTLGPAACAGPFRVGWEALGNRRLCRPGARGQPCRRIKAAQVGNRRTLRRVWV